MCNFFQIKDTLQEQQESRSHVYNVFQETKEYKNLSRFKEAEENSLQYFTDRWSRFQTFEQPWVNVHPS